MKVICLGVDPAGLYLAALLKTSGVAADVEIVDGQADAPTPPHVMEHPLKPGARLADDQLDRAIKTASRSVRGVRIRAAQVDRATDNQAYAFIDAVTLTDLLCERARELGCRLISGPTPSSAALAEADLVIVAEGAESPTRAAKAAFGTVSETSTTRHFSFDVDLASERLEYWFHRTPHGVVQASLTPAGSGSVLRVETTLQALQAAGLASADATTIPQFCAEVFAGDLAGRSLHPRDAGWRSFNHLRNASWSAGNMVLVGAAAYNAHPSVGLDMRMAMADAEAFAEALAKGGAIPETLKIIEAARRPKGAESLQRASKASLAWFENVHRYIAMPPAQFAVSCLTRSMRVTHEHLKSWAPELVGEIDALAAGAMRGRNGAPPPPMLTPYQLGGLTLPNRIVMSPMCMYSAEDGTVNDFHLVHYGSRAIGGAGLIIAEMTDVSPEGRISPGCAGMYKPEHVTAWKRVVDFVKKNSETKIGLQLAHAGRKGAISASWDGHAQLPPDKAWETLAPSAIPFDKDRTIPRAMDRAEMDRVRDAFARATEMANEAGFDMLEVHLAHGYLLSSFISPLSNKRTDDYGGPLENRLRYPLEVLRAVRRAWPQDKPITVRISAHDMVDGGTTIEDSILFSRWIHEAGADMITVSTGAVTAERRPMVGRLYQTTWSDQIRNETKIPTMAVGGVASFADANTIIAAGRADLCAMARGYMFDPYFPRHAAHQQGYRDMRWPNQYRGANALVMRDFD